MNKSLRLRREKARARNKTAKLLAQGRLRKEDISAAAAVPGAWIKGPLLLDKLRKYELDINDV